MFLCDHSNLLRQLKLRGSMSSPVCGFPSVTRHGFAKLGFKIFHGTEIPGEIPDEVLRQCHLDIVQGGGIWRQTKYFTSNKISTTETYEMKSRFYNRLVQNTTELSEDTSQRESTIMDGAICSFAENINSLFDKYVQCSLRGVEMNCDKALEGLQAAALLSKGSGWVKKTAEIHTNPKQDRMIGRLIFESSKIEPTVFEFTK